MGSERLSSQEQGELSEQACPGGVPGVTLGGTFICDPGAEHTAQPPGAAMRPTSPGGKATSKRQEKGSGKQGRGRRVSLKGNRRR